MKSPVIKPVKISTPKKAKGKPEPLPNFEEETSKEVSEYNRKLRAQTRLEQEQIEKATSTGFYFCVYFADTEQRDEFIKNAGLEGANIGQFFNGETFAKKVGVKLTKKRIDKPKVFRMHKNLKHLSQ